MFAVCIPANHEIYTKFSKSVKNITLSNLVQEISLYCICEGIKNEKFSNIPTNILFQKYLTQMLQHHQHLQNFTDQLHVHIYAKPISAPTAKNLKIKKTSYVQKFIKKQEAMNLIPAKTKAPISKTSTEFLKLALQHYLTENKFLKEKIDELQSEIKIVSGS